jgi:hypothetical protein
VNPDPSTVAGTTASQNLTPIPDLFDDEPVEIKSPVLHDNLPLADSARISAESTNKYMVYYYKDKNSKTIYIGKTSKSILFRAAEHENKSWWSEVAYIGACEVKTEEAMKRLETMLIERDRPIGNIMNNPDNKKFYCAIRDQVCEECGELYSYTVYHDRPVVLRKINNDLRNKYNTLQRQVDSLTAKLSPIEITRGFFKLDWEIMFEAMQTVEQEETIAAVEEDLFNAFCYLKIEDILNNIRDSYIREVTKLQILNDQTERECNDINPF